jgi:DNA (cytosine-5)-methyltransferase 1
MTAYYNEIDPKAAAWLRELIKQGHIADGVVDERSIVDVSPDELRAFTQCHFFAGIGVWSYALRSAGWADDRPVWTGSCPCQPFSSAGRRGGVDDERHLWPHWHHLISQCQPSVVFGEQVASKDGLGWLDLVSTDMEATGYAFGAADLCAAGVGAPHIRQRLFFGAVRLADADSQRRDGINALLRQEQGNPVEAAGSGEASGLADADSGQRGRVADGEGCLTDRTAPGRQQGDSEPERGGTGFRLADAADAGLSVGQGGSGWTPGSVEQSERLRADVGMADADGNGRDKGVQQISGRTSERIGGSGINHGMGNANNQGSQEHGGFGDIHLWQPNREDQGGQHVNSGLDVRQPRPAGPTNGHWRDADWLFCRDGKWRPVEPGTSPLADGAAERVGRLRGYGNAIVAQAAQAFIESMMEIAG